jgi:predicted TIM-barrel fold metal-dependent hydrolase
MFFVEAGFFSHRALWMLIFAGVFDRYPSLKLILTEGGAEWAPGVLEVLDGHWRRVFGGGRYGMGPFAAMRKMGLGEGVPILNAFGGMQKIEMMPSDYFKRNVWIGSSFTAPKENAVRYAIGVDKMMWGNDYPHSEATYPYTREALRWTFAETPPAEVARMLGANAFDVYDFDVDQLREVAARIEAPTISEVRVPLTESEIPEDAMSQAFEDSVNRVW